MEYCAYDDRGILIVLHRNTEEALGANDLEDSSLGDDAELCVEGGRWILLDRDDGQMEGPLQLSVCHVGHGVAHALWDDVG